MILLWGLLEDRPMLDVKKALARLGHPPTFLDQRKTIHASIQLSVDSQIEGTIKTNGRTIDLHAVKAFYLRPYDSRQLYDVQQAGRDSPLWNQAIMVDDMLTSWADITDALVINRPSAMAINSSKPYQAMVIRSLGFEVPDTLITTEPEAVLEFWERHERVVYKSISGVRSIVSQLTPDHKNRLQDVVWCPTQFQEYVPGTDYRVHVVGDEAFSCRIVSNADDYRYASQHGSSVQIQACDLPAEVVDLCIATSKKMGLSVSGIDLKQTPEGKWYCFEVNPSPGFTYFQNLTDKKIDEAIAHMLINGPD